MSSVPLFNDPKAAAKVQSCLKEVYKSVQAAEKERTANVEGCQAAIEAAHEKIVNDDRLTAAMRNRLKSLYEEGVRNAEKVVRPSAREKRPALHCQRTTLPKA